jgi:hypothetical protein
VTDGEDEAERRAREALARRSSVRAVADTQAEELHIRTETRRAEWARAVPDVLEDIAAEVSQRTTHSVALFDDGLACFLGPITAYQTRRLLTVVTTAESADIEADEWAIEFNCEGHAYLDENGEPYEDSGFGLERGEAVEFGVEAVLDGLASCIAEGAEILDVAKVLVPTPPEPVAHQPDPVIATVNDRLTRPARLAASPALLTLVGALLVVALVSWIIVSRSQ